MPFDEKRREIFNAGWVGKSATSQQADLLSCFCCAMCKLFRFFVLRNAPVFLWAAAIDQPSCVGFLSVCTQLSVCVRMLVRVGKEN